MAVATACVTASAENVTATWTLGDKNATDNVPAVISPMAGGISAVMTTPLTFRQVRTITTADGEELSFSSYRYKEITANVINEECRFTFTVTPDAAVQLRKMTFDIAGVSTGDAQCAVYVNGAEIYRTSGSSNALGRTDRPGDRAVYTHSADLTSVAASSEPVEVTLYAYARVNVAENGKEIALANVVIEADAIAGEVPVYKGEQAPLAAGSFFDLTDAVFDNCRIEANDRYAVGNTRNGSSIEFPFYTMNEGDFLLYLGVGLQNNNESELTLYVDGQEAGVMTAARNDGWTSFSNVNMFHLQGLPQGQHTLRVEAATATTYAGNWRMAVYSMEDYSVGNEINLAAGSYANGIRHEHNGTNAGNIRNGATAEYMVFLPDNGNATDNYMLEMYVLLYDGGTVTIEIPEDNFMLPGCEIKDWSAAAAPALRAVTAPVYSDHYSIGLDNLTPGLKTLRMSFAADHSGYIANYSNLSVSRRAPGQTTGVEDVTAGAEPASVEFYNLQGVRVDAGYKGAVIRVSVDRDGRRVADKLFNR